jgi:hypothetical protein
MNDKRKFERFEVSVPASLEVLKPEEKTEKMALEISNLSASGIFIKTDKLIPEGSPVKMEIYLHFRESETETSSQCATIIIVTGRILRTTEEGLAIHFNEDYDITSTEDSGVILT